MQNNYFKKYIYKNKYGFTLVELLLVMAVIAILVGAIMIGISSSRKRAKVTAALKTANNVAVELAHCYLNNYSISSPSAGTKICSGAGNWPDVSKFRCSYTGYVGNILTIDCTANGGATITCDTKDSGCNVSY